MVNRSASLEELLLLAQQRCGLESKRQGEDRLALLHKDVWYMVTDEQARAFVLGLLTGFDTAWLTLSTQRRSA